MIIFADDYVAAQPLNHARIGHNNLTPDATIVGSSTASGYDDQAVAIATTWERWKPSAGATLTLTWSSNQVLEYIGLAAHTLGTEGAVLSVEYKSGSSWLPLSFTFPGADVGPSLSLDFGAQVYGVYGPNIDDSALILAFNTINTDGIRLTLSAAAEIGVVYTGTLLDMFRPFYAGHTPVKLSRKTVSKPNKSEGGQWLGKSIIRKGLNTSFNWENIPLSWYRDNVDPFVEDVRAAPFFIAWNPKRYPEQCGYMWTGDDISPSLSGTRDLVGFGFKAEGVE